MTPDEAMYIVGIALLIFSAVLIGGRQKETFATTPPPSSIVIHAVRDAMAIIPPMETVMDNDIIGEDKLAVRVNPDQVEGLMVKHDPSILQRAKAVYNVQVDVPGTYRLTVVSDVPSIHVNPDATPIPQNKMNTMFIGLGPDGLEQRQLLTLGTGYSHTKQGTASLTFPTPGVHKVTLSYSPRSGIWGRVARIILRRVVRDESNNELES